MRIMIVFASALLLGSAGAHAENLMGSGALALAALTGEHSPNVSNGDKKLLSSMLNGDLT